MAVQYNQRPSNLQNIGSDILGAARHRNDTYENPEREKQKREAKQAKNDLKGLLENYKFIFATALSESTESAQKVLKEYEFKKAIMACALFKEFSDLETIKNCDLMALKSIVIGEREYTKREIMRKAFNTLHRKQHKIRYIRPIELAKYFEPKTREAFTEFNGVKSLWRTESKSADINALGALTRAVQFGNSVPDIERIYCAENLLKAIEILKKYFSIDFNTLGFSFGARGRAGCIAHYQDGAKVLAFNRHWDGALIHELVHAIDYSLGLVSDTMPYAIVQKYKAKLVENNAPNKQYYFKRKEIFARLFEKYCESKIRELTPFMYAEFNPSVMPELNEESIRWIDTALKEILK